MMVKKGIVCLLSSVVLNAAAQNQVQQFYSNTNLANQAYVQQRANPVLASNVSNINKANAVKVNVTNSNKRTTANQTVQRRPVQQNAQRNVNPPVQIQNEDIQIQTNVSDNNVGNELNNFEVIQIQHLSNVAVPAIPQMGNAGMELKLPKVNLGVSRKKVKSGSSHHSKKKIVLIKNKIKKANRKWCTKLEGKKKLRLKVDRCFNW
ncbi:MAG: hypothetical protein J0L69_05815 [Bacteroidetes bacterium]|nr:hypothetical protein [Bacteroidota bacterium]